MIIKYILVNVVLLVNVMFSSAQGILHLQMPDDPAEKIYGPNRKHYAQGTLSVGLNLFQESPDGIVSSWYSQTNMSLGGRYLRRLNNRFAFVNNLSIMYKSFRLQPDESVMNSYQHLFDEVEIIARSQTALVYAPGLRVSIQKRRGNIIGKYIDVQGFFALTLRRSETVEGFGQSGEGELRMRLTEGTPFHYGATFRLGYNRLALFVNYFIANTLYENSILILFGVELSI